MAEVDRHDDALEEDRESFILRSAREMVEEWGESVSADNATMANNHLSPIQIICLPARDEADRIIAMILRQMLETAGLRSAQLARGLMVGEIIQEILQESVPIVCICALPPFAVVHTRSLQASARSPA